MTKRIFRSIFLVAMTVFLATMVLILGVMHSYSTNAQFSQLRVETALASHALTNEGIRYFEKLDDTMDCRITWIASDGTVLYDNRSDTGSMVNHLQREEVRSALETGYGQSARYSDTLLQRSIYAAELLPDGTVLRLSTSQSSVLNLLLSMWQPVALIFAAALLLSITLARRLSQNIVRPLNTMHLDNPLSNRVYSEVLPLLRRLDAQQRQLRLQSRELEQKQKEFATVTQALSEGLVLISSSGSILSINPAAARLLDVTPNCIGADFSVANRNPTIAGLVEQGLSGQKAESNVPLASGAYLAAARPVRAEGTLSGVVLLLFDITQKQQAEQLRREFTANVSHELKTPLHAISGYAELLKSGMVSQEDTPGFSQRIYSETQRLIRLVEDILRLSHLDDGALDMQWSSVNLQDTVSTVLRELKAPAELSGVTLCAEGGGAVIPAIPQLVFSIIYNLTDNAIKYNRPGGKVVLRIENQTDHVRLHVCDTGIGIPEEHLQRIFERFYRVDKSHSKAVGGTGLGLSIVKHAAIILNAEIDLHSIVDQGTTVTVTFRKTAP